MSASQTPPGTTGADPSMEDILASIRRILSEDEAPAADGNPPALTPPAGEGVLVLDPVMMVPESPPPDTPRVPEPPPRAAVSANLVAPEAAAAAASSVGSLVRTLAE